jgi:crossover junction endodeoxyribonuclease RuvC
VLGLMSLIAVATRAPWPRDARHWFHIGVAGLLVHAVYLGGVFVSISKGLPAGVSSLVVGIQPLLTAVGAGWLLGETVLARQWLGLVLGFVGVAMVVSGKLGSGFGLDALWPALIALAGITAGTLYQKRFCPSFDWRTGAIAQFLPTALVTAIVRRPDRGLPRRMGARLHLRPGLAGAGAVPGRRLPAQLADPPRQRGEHRQPVLPGAAHHRADGLGLVRRAPGRDGPGRHGARRLGRVSGAEMTAASSTPIRILGIDPGLRSTGFGLIDKTGSALAYVASGCVKTDSDGSLPQRIATILDGLAEIIATYHPQQAAVEIVFVNVNPQSTLLLGQARGAAIAALVTAKLPVAEYTALQVKQAVVGHGKAAKEQVQPWWRACWRCPARPAADAADALACAICHAQAAQRPGRPGRARRPAPRRAYHRAASCLNAFPRHPRQKKSPIGVVMIGRLTGTLLEKNPPRILLDVQGVGYEIDVPMSTFYNLPAPGEQVTLHTHFVVREDGHFLFGFGTPAEQAAFRQLVKITGIGAAHGAGGAVRHVGG